jgi:hypothetical protein
MYSYQLLRQASIPLLPNIQGAVLAFARTSKYGVWEPFKGQSDNPFAMNFYRGDWRFKGNGAMVPKRGSNHGYAKYWSEEALATHPATFTVFIRPDPKRLLLSLVYRFCWRSAPTFILPGALSRCEAAHANYASKEADELTEYLKSFLKADSDPLPDRSLFSRISSDSAFPKE